MSTRVSWLRVVNHEVVNFCSEFPKFVFTYFAVQASRYWSSCLCLVCLKTTMRITLSVAFVPISWLFLAHCAAARPLHLNHAFPLPSRHLQCDAYLRLTQLIALGKSCDDIRKVREQSIDRLRISRHARTASCSSTK